MKIEKLDERGYLVAEEDDSWKTNEIVTKLNECIDCLNSLQESVAALLVVHPEVLKELNKREMKK